MMLLTAYTPLVMSQTSASSPFSMYGLGEVKENLPVAYRSMGGVGIGMRSNKAINPSQPASYTACDSLTFMIDVAAGISWSNYKDATGQRNRANGNLEYVTLQFPLWRQHIAMSLGTLPYCETGYNVSNKGENAYGTYTSSYEGSGSISQLYAGLSFNILDWVAVGANGYYLLGEMSRNATLSFSSSALTTTSQGAYIKPSSFRYRVGMQVFHTFGDHGFILGGTFESKMPMKSIAYHYEVSSEVAFDTIRNAFDLPMMIGVGASYTWQKRLTIALDYNLYKWSEVNFYNHRPTVETDGFAMQDRQRIALGVQYCDNPMSRQYAGRMLWRAGLTLSKSYVSAIHGTELTATVGMGFPLSTVGSQVNTSIEYTRRGTRDTMVDNTFKFTIGISVCENWFFKRRI